ncbi:MAG: hypothetical protein HKP58_00845 [Desulfatitalea sp.]|nr:IS66 family insertion sequence element accessory protein TnpB [Desulfatitalea sp.]NNJ98933.1 hypothetical protein [Desulfatitalea sp.]
MIAIVPHMRILLAIEPADFRKGIDGLARICRNHLKSDPFSGAMFVFRNKAETFARPGIGARPTAPCAIWFVGH